MSYLLEYAKSSRAKCKGFGTCSGSTIEKGTLRLGENRPNQWGSESTSWTHWGCVTPTILRRLGRIGVHAIPGFSHLNFEDKEKVRKAVKEQKVSDEDIPPSARTLPLPDLSQVVSSQKRKREEPTASSSRHTLPGPSTSSARNISDAEDGTDDEDEAPADEVYLTFASKVVGVRYYHGLVGPGEAVSLVREPTNQYDTNAIRVDNISNTQVGHIPKAPAKKLAPLMDANLITVEGTMRQGNLAGGTIYELSIDLHIIGPSAPESRKQLEPLLVWATPGQRGFEAMRNQTGVVGLSPKKGPKGKGKQVAAPDEDESEKGRELRSIVEALQKIDDERRRLSLLDTLCGGNVLDLPLHDAPPSVRTGELNNDLLKHQSQALRWCIEAENPTLPKKETDQPIQFWQVRDKGKKHYFNLATKTPQTAPPPLGRGGLMADAMGLGKTLTMLSLILATRSHSSPGFSNTTLIVVPLSVLSNWQGQLQEHITDKHTLKTHVYYGPGRDASAKSLAKYDVVLTTYQVVAGELPGGNGKAKGKAKRKVNDSDSDDPGPERKKKKVTPNLFNVKWKRIILDEGHTIRNSKTKMFQAACDLQAERRWVVTGTPIINSPADLGSLLSFLRICTPLDQPEYFKRLLARPLSKGEREAAELLKAVMSSICLRRTKEMHDHDGKPLVPLPPVEVVVVKVALDPESRRLYDTVESESRNKVAEFVDAGFGPEQMPLGCSVLSMLTRLRQIALHPSLIPPNYIEELQHMAVSSSHRRAPVINSSPQERARLQALLFQALQDNEECPICFDPLKEGRILPCTHFFCLDCIAEVITRKPQCPMDRGSISMGDLIEPAAAPADDFDAEENTITKNQDVSEPSSAKIDQLIRLLKLQPKKDKSLVFSQFTSFLDKIAIQLLEHGIPFVRFDGSMSAKKRQQVLEVFSQPLESPNKEHNPVVLLISLKAGALGLNLTVANNVFLMDPWWQESIESQAIDRVNRIGQKKVVRVYQMIASDTVEEKVVEIQERKNTLIRHAFSGNKQSETPRHKREARMQELMELFKERS